MPSDRAATLRGRALLLDLDGTLIDSTAAIAASWELVADAMGVERSVVAPLVHGIPPRQVVAEVAPWLDVVERERMVEMFFDGVIGSTGPVEWMPGAQRLIAGLDDVAWAVVTSGGARLAASSMAKVGMVAPPVVVTADDVSVGKPDPAPYLQAAERLGVEPADCVVIEDAPAGVEAGRRAGMAVVGVTATYPADELAAATVVVDGLPTLTVLDGGWFALATRPADLGA